MKKISYYPAPTKGNQYIKNSINAIEAAIDTEVEIIWSVKKSLTKSIKSFLRKRNDVCVVNWLENSLKSKNNKISVFGVLKFFVLILCFRLIAKKVIYVRHNIYPHNMKYPYAKIAQYITDFGEKLCSIKVSHSGHLNSRGYKYIPHPLYQMKSDRRDSTSSDYYIIFGRITEYKKIEDIVLNWDLDDRLIIAGSVESQSYLERLTKLAVGKNVNFHARFIPEEEASALVSGSQGLILAHAENDMVVSGSFFFAVTLGVPVYAIRMPFYDWIKAEYDFSGIYIADTPEKIIKMLSPTRNTRQLNFKGESKALFGHKAVTAHWKRHLASL